MCCNKSTLKYTTIIILILIALVSGTAQAESIAALPSDLRIYDKTGVQIDPPDLELGGMPLIMSNSSETIKTFSGASAFYRTKISKDHFRVFFHHLNATSETLRIGIAITNPSSAKSAVELYIGQNSQGLPTKRESTVHSSPVAVGGIALRNWFLSSNKDSYLATLKPGKTYYLLQNTAPGATITGMYDFGIKAAKKNAPVPNVFTTVLICKDTPADPTVISVLPPEKSDGGWYRRGTFAHSERTGRVECDTTHVHWIDIAGPHEGKYACPMKNEFEHAIDDPNGFNPGNYGVVYSLRISLKNPSSQIARVRSVLSAAGGISRSNVKVNGTYLDSGKTLCAYESWVCKDVIINPGQTVQFNLKFSLPGGSSGAHRLYFWPGDPNDSIKRQEVVIHL